MKKANESLVLGLDLGTNSIGWALFGFDGDNPVRLVGMGSRIFEAGTEGDIEAGKDESRGVARRMARQIRRQGERRARRQSKVGRVLQAMGLLPEGDIDHSQARHEYFVTLDRTLRARHKKVNLEALPHVFPYWLRARALDNPLERDELGRAFYHLGQRRGFLSNRKASGKKDEEKSVVKQGIAELAAAIHETGARTLGEYLSRIDPSDPEQRRIRERWTARQMYEDEFNAIWDAQSKHHPEVLTPEWRKILHNALFRQRPLKLQHDLIGACPLEPDRKRAPMALPAAQRFRVLQKVNDLRVIAPDYSERPLNPEERTLLLDALDRQEEMTFGKLRKLLNLKAYVFNLENGGEEKLIGNRTSAKMYGIFGERWFRFTPAQREAVIQDIRCFEKDAALAKRGREHYGLDEETAKRFGEIELEDGYCSLSRQAIEKLLPLMEKGIAYKTAEKEVYGDPGPAIAVEMLPSVAEAVRQQLMPVLRNPVVNRVLTELRKVVNAIINKYGKPDKIRIEIARDMKKPRQERMKISRKMRDNEKSRQKAAKRIFEEIGVQNPSRDDIEKVLLAEECEWRCPYTGKTISMRTLLGDAPQFDVEHIIPFSRCLDNSFNNKTLCYHEENRSVKRNRTPHEAYGGDPARYQEILDRVAKFKGEGRDAKLRRFQMADLEDFEDFSTRMLNDTRYASTLAAKYLGLLYGAEYRKHIQVSTGVITKYLRDCWGLNKVLGDGGEKNREDHRHHAVDAVAIALTSPKTVKMLSDAAKHATEERRRQFGKVPPPWDRFLQDIQEAAGQIVVSHRVARKVNGRMHEDTFYSPQPSSDPAKPCVHVRKRVEALSKGEIEAIVDPIVRRQVKQRLDELDSDDPKKAFATAEKHPFIETGDGRRLPIHKVRIRKNAATFKIGKEHRVRHVTTDSNHHVEIIETTDKRGNVKWEGSVVSRYEAMRRLQNREPVIKRDHGNGRKFLFSLALNEVVQMKDTEGVVRQYRVAGVSQFSTGQIVIDVRELSDARRAVDVPREGRTRSPDTLRKSESIKFCATPLGELRRAND
ncbi:MAG TPA: type II CRISPR RNA-guided endonuclease Cas9 [Candidatus Hydrogenedentes bacterium]|nr:type II CRISPR RNA-guided endonuclease Cas9 [Candidatus Hydrogenedentota bacterium]